MKLLVALLALLWAAGNLFAAGLMLTNGIAAKTASKGLTEQGLLVLGALLLAALALLLIWQCVDLVRSETNESA